jgi:adenylate cyclase class 2
MKDIEIEIQVNIEKPEALMDFLRKNAEFKSERRQVDRYFTPAHRDFTAVRPVNEWLRLREADGLFSLNYKNWHRDENGMSHYCDEYEIKIENLETAGKIFNALDFRPVVTVDKIRKAWIYKKYKITLDAVRDVGDFVEIEYINGGEDVEPAEITGEMVEFLKSIDCGKIRRNYQGYAFRALFPGEAKDEEI